MAGNLTAIVRADTSGFAEQVQQAKDMVNKFTQEMKASGTAISGVTNQQVKAYNRVVRGLEKVVNSNQTTKQSQASLRRQIEKLKEQWSDLSDEAKRSDFGKLIGNSISTARSELRKLNQQLDQTSSKMDQFKSSSKRGSKGSKGGSKNKSSEIAESAIQALSDKISALGGKAGGVMSLISKIGPALANPYVAAAAAVGACVGAVAVYGMKLSEQINKVQQFANVNVESATLIRGSIASICDIYDKDFDEVLQATNSLAKQMKISFQEAAEAIELGMASGADATGELLNMVKEYPAYLREAGIDATGFMAIMQTSVQAGVFSDKGVDAIKEANLRLREMTPATQQALNAIGLSSSEVQRALRDGSKTTFEIMQEVSKKLKELPESSSEVGQAIADIFGGPGEDAGLQYLQMLADIDTSTEGVIAKMTEQQRATYELQQAQEDLQNCLARLFGMSEGGWQTMVTQLKRDVVRALVKAINWFIELYNKSGAVREGVAAIAWNFKATWIVVKTVCKAIVEGLGGVAQVIDDIVSFHWIDAVKHAQDVKYKAITIATEGAAEIGKAFVAGAIDAASNQIKKITPPDETEPVETEPNTINEYAEKIRSLQNQLKNLPANADKATVDSIKKEIAKYTKLKNSLEKKVGLSKTTSGGRTSKSSSKPSTTKEEPKSYLESLEDKKKELEKFRLRLPIDVSEEDVKLINDKIKEFEEKIHQHKIKIGVEVDKESLKKQEDLKKIQDKYSEIKADSAKDKRSSYEKAVGNILDEDTSKMSSQEKYDFDLSALEEQMNKNDEFISQLEEQKQKLIENGHTSSETYSQICDDIQKVIDKNQELAEKTTEVATAKATDAEKQDKLNKKNEKMSAATNAVNQWGSSLSSLGDALGIPELNIAGTIGQAIANVAMSYSQATSQAAGQGPWAWIAFAAAGLAQMISVITSIKSATSGYAEGGIISGNRVGDMNIARVNGGEMILNGTQQSRLFNLLDGNGGYATHSTVVGGEVKIKGSDLYIALNNYNKKSVKSKRL